jgi:threonyl-tRNA synthetase
MASITLPDGSIKQIADGSTVAELAESIGKRLAAAAVVGRVDGKLVDLSYKLTGDHAVQILTDRDADALAVMRHSTAHVLAQALRRIYGKEVQYTIGPVIENGFFYDFELPPGFSADALPKVEAEMQKIVDENCSFSRSDVVPAEARAALRGENQRYKDEIIDELEQQGEKTVSTYRQGEFLDLCRGPHVPATGKIKAFKLTSVAGAYWRGDSNRQQLTRIYGTAFFDKKHLDEHLKQLEEAKARDHRVIGQKLGLFVIDEQVGPGLVLWKPKGATLRIQLQEFLQQELLRRGYQMVYTPQIGRLELYRTSGHFPYYRDKQFPPLFQSRTSQLLGDLWEAIAKRPEDGPISEGEQQVLEQLRQADSDVYGKLMPAGESGKQLAGRGHKSADQHRIREMLKNYDDYLLRPMNCPHHIKIFASEPRSYRALPIRLAEFGNVYRFEQSGELSGLTRVRGFTQDDAHIFCTQDQVKSEYRSTIELVQFVFSRLGFKDVQIRLSKHDPNDDKFAGNQSTWLRAEQEIRDVLDELKVEYVEAAGEAAFYGPKADFMVRDVIGREWQLGTVQLDYVLPERFGLEYIGSDNKAHRPVMIHRAPFGSMERFIGILIEHFGGDFPLWLAPIQAIVLPISDKVIGYAREVVEALTTAGIRTEIDASPERIQAKVREASLAKIPYKLIVGQQEAQARTIAVRTAADEGAKPLAEVVERLQKEVAERA